MSQALPVVLTYQDPEPPDGISSQWAGPAYPGRLGGRALASHARRSVFGPIAAIFIALGLLLVALPRTSAYVLAALCAWFALGAAREAFRRRADR